MNLLRLASQVTMGERFPVSALVLLGILAALPCSAQNTRPEVGERREMAVRASAKSKAAPKSRDAALMERALSESYTLGAGLSPEARIRHLISLCSSAAEVGSLGAKQHEWLEELFRLAGEMAPSDDLRSNAQATAVRLMAPLDVKRSLQFFDALEAPSKQGYDPRQWVARELFAKMLKEQGAKAIPAVRARARKLGETGSYPYGGMLPVLSKLKDQPQKAAEVFAEALTYYRRGKTQTDGVSFINFVGFLRGAHRLKIIPYPLMHEATQEVATEIMRGSADSSQPDIDSLDHPYSYFHAAYVMLQDIDPELAKTLKATRSSRWGGSTAMQEDDQWNRTHNAAKYNGDAEYQQLRARTDDLIRNIMEMSENGKQHSPEMQTAIAEAMSSGVKATERTIEVDPSNADAFRRNAPELVGVVDAASKIAPAMTLNEIESVQDTEIRAYLLIQFATSISELQFMRDTEKTEVAEPVAVETK